MTYASPYVPSLMSLANSAIEHALQRPRLPIGVFHYHIRVG